MYSVISFLYSVILFLYSVILFLFSVILFLYSVILFILYSVVFPAKYSFHVTVFSEECYYIKSKEAAAACTKETICLDALPCRTTKVFLFVLFFLSSGWSTANHTHTLSQPGISK